MRDGVPYHKATNRIEKLSRIDPDILAAMKQLLGKSEGPLKALPEPEEPVGDLIDFASPASAQGVEPPRGTPEDFSSLPVFVEQPSNAPPLHPASVDRGRFRIAEEPPGTDLYQPWVLDRCIECREAVWTHNAAVAAEHKTVCETCYYVLVSDYWERQTRQRRQMAYRVVNPFES